MGVVIFIQLIKDASVLLGCNRMQKSNRKQNKWIHLTILYFKKTRNHDKYWIMLVICT